MAIYKNLDGYLIGNKMALNYNTKYLKKKELLLSEYMLR